MSSWGVQQNGFIPQQLQDALASIEADLQAAFGSGIRLDATSVYGQIAGIMALRFADQWAALQDAYDSSFITSARGLQLDNLLAVRGLTRNPATYSTAVLTLTGTNGTVIPLGSSVKDASGNVWLTTASATIASGTAAVVASPATTGVFTAPAGTLTIINSPVSGWTASTNAASLPGSPIESDNAFVQRAIVGYSGGSSCSVQGLEGALIKLSGVSAVNVIENTDINTNIATSQPGKSVQCVVQGGTTANIVQAIWNNKPSGIATYGNASSTIVDSLGITRTINYSTPTQVPIYIIVSYHKDITKTFPSSGEAQMLAAILAYGQTLLMGQEVNPWLMGQQLTVSGIDQLTIYLGTSAGPTSTAPVPIQSTQLAQILSANITFSALN